MYSDYHRKNKLDLSVDPHSIKNYSKTFNSTARSTMNCNAQNTAKHPSNLPRSTMVVGVVQFKGSREQYTQSQDRLIEIISDAGEHGVELIVTPECVCSEYFFSTFEEARLYAERTDGTFAKALIECSVTWGMWCFVGVIEQGVDGRLFNSAFITNPDGELYVYRKRLLFDADEIWATSGEEYPVEVLKPHSLGEHNLAYLSYDPSPPYPLFDVHGWKVTVGICMDLNDPRFLNFCAHADVDLIAFPTNWIDEGKPVLNYWAALLQGMHRATLLAANSYGLDGDYTLSGHSSILQASPPTLLGEAPKVGDYIITCTLDYLVPLQSAHKEFVEE